MLAFEAYAAMPAGARCLDDPGDAAQVANARAAVDDACRCFGVASRGEYVACAAAVVNDRVEMLLLRSECRGLLRRVHVKAVCGRDIESVPGGGPTVPCVTKDISSGRVVCAMKQLISFVSKNSLTKERAACSAHTHCLHAADENGDLDLAPPGDTGECAALPDTLTDNGDGTITDTRTHLMWEKLADDGSIHDRDDEYSWSDAFDVKVAALNSGGFAGYADWRVPRLHELMTLIRLGPAPMIAAEFDTACVPGCTVLACSCTKSDYYWSASPLNSPDATNVWLAGYHGGGVAHSFHSNSHPVRAVRSLP